MGIDSIAIALNSLRMLLKNPIIILPFLISNAFSFFLSAFVPAVPKTAPITERLAALPAAALTGIISLLAGIFFTIMAMKMARDAIKSRPSVEAAAGFVLSRYLPFLLAMLAISLIIAASFLPALLPLAGIMLAAPSKNASILFVLGLLLIAGIFASVLILFYLIFRFSMAVYILVLEDRGVRDSFMKSWRITKNNVLSIIFLSVLIIAPSLLLIGTAAAAIGSGAETFLKSAQSPESTANMPLAAIILIISSVSSSWSVVAYVMLYLQLRRTPSSTAARSRR
ncbi:MAG: glycerophosphoryl diester phosphodiesterase membrane domain-containing protein [Candidatus Aenigmarchaeota archaeon]|nr:glycerophosphoryl diester phosphodiesterase membrane domain-containing protein [Candidatus Aenigmarchaeota archaeon]